METPLRALILEDSHSDTLLLLRELKRAGYEVDFTRVDNAQDMLAALEDAVWDVILSDFSMPDFNATTALKLVQELGIDIPFIIVSGTMGEETAVAAMKAGAHDYFPKGKIARLAAAINREVREAQERRQRRMAEEELRRAEERFTKAFQVSPIGVTISNTQAVFLSANDAFHQMLGFASGSIVARTPVEIGIWDSAEDHKLLQGHPGGYQSIRDRDVKLLTQSGEIRHVSLSTETVELGGETCVLAMWQDITERKRVEEALKKHIRLMELIGDVTTAANQATEVNNALQIAMDHICRFTGWAVGHTYVRTRGDLHQLSPSSVWHVSQPEKLDRFRDSAYRTQLSEIASNLAYRVFNSRSPEWVTDVELVVHTSDPADELVTDIRAAYAFPVFADQEVAAVMGFFSATAAELDPSLMDMLPHIMAQIGHVIERTQANDEIKALYDATAYLFNAESVHGLAQQIVRAVVEQFEHVDCGLLLVDKQTNELNRVARTGHYQVNTQVVLMADGPGLIAKAVREGRIVYAPDVHQVKDYVANVPATQSEIVVPLRTRSGIIGALDLQSTQRNYFNQRDQRVLTTFAERAGAALEIIQLYEEINQHAAQLEVRVAERTRELQEAKERVETILHNSSDAVILLHADGSIQQTNPRFDELLGYERDQLFREDLSRVISMENLEGWNQIVDFGAPGDKYARFEVLAKRKDGSVFPADAAFAAFSLQQETGIICSLRDISQQKQLEQELRAAFERQKELAELKTRFISTVSHEYRTPLAIIYTSSSMLLKYSDRMTNEQQQPYLEKIKAHVNRLTALLDDVLEISRTDTLGGGSFNPEEVNIADACREIVEDMQQVYPDHPVELVVAGEMRPVAADVKLLRQIISNLLSNAIKYSPPQRAVQVSLAFANNEVVIKVKDQGMGIPEEDLDKLFGIFHRARNVGDIAGTGLGLAIVKNAVDAHQGRISVESNVGEGSVFTVVLPA